jgi:hypothetical protein
VITTRLLAASILALTLTLAAGCASEAPPPSDGTTSIENTTSFDPSELVPREAGHTSRELQVVDYECTTEMWDLASEHCSGYHSGAHVVDCSYDAETHMIHYGYSYSWWA